MLLRMDECELTEILLPIDNQYVKEFKLFPPEKQIQILTLGITAFNYSMNKFKLVIDGEKENIIEKLTTKHINEVNNYKSEIIKGKETIKELKQTNYQQKIEFNQTFETKIREQKIDLQNIFERQYGEKITQLNEKINELEQKKENLQVEKMQQQQNYYEKLLEEREMSQQYKNKLRQEFDDKIEKYREKLDTFQKINQNSTLKGQKGEDMMYNLLIKSFPGCQIDTHTSKEAHKGDFSVIDDTHHGMIESKNYKKNVPKNEIVKFYKDIENNNDIDYAILCSLKSGVANKPQDFTLEFIMGKPVIFLHKVKDNEKSVKVAYNICKLILKNMQCFDITKEENQQKIKQIVKTYLQTHKKIISLSNDYNKNINDMMRSQVDSFNDIIRLINIEI